MRKTMTRRRGRPRAERPSVDTGTPELIAKRIAGVTTETLDLCLERGIVTTEQHWCGIHLRWLHTLRFGAPGVRAVDTTSLGGLEIKLDDPEWKSAREKEYQHALSTMGAPLSRVALGLCVYNERPIFLCSRQSATESARRELAAFIDALGILVKCWCCKGKINTQRSTI